MDTVPLTLLEHFDPSFLKELPIFPPTDRGRTGEHEHPNCSKEFSNPIWVVGDAAFDLQPPLPTTNEVLTLERHQLRRVNDSVPASIFI